MREYLGLAPAICMGVLFSALDTTAQTTPAPERSVYSVVTETDEEEGVATLLNDKSGLFITASHVVLNPKDLRIRVGDKLFDFSVVLRGSNILRTVEDWALIQITDQNWIDQLPLPSQRLVYDLPGSAEMRDSSIITSDKSSGAIVANEIPVDLDGSIACDTDSIILAQTSHYDKGNSGAPVYIASDSKKGVFAITSRFAADTAEDNSETIQLFAKLSKQIEDGKPDEGPINVQVLRDLLKNSIYIKLLPIKCIVDEIDSHKELKSKLFSMDIDQSTQDVLQYIPSIKTPGLEDKVRNRKLINTLNAINGAGFDLISMLRVIDKFASSYEPMKNEELFISLPLYDGIARASSRINASTLPIAYIKAYNTVADIDTGSLLAPITGQGGTSSTLKYAVKSFVDHNDQWVYSPTQDKVQFDLTGIAHSAFPPTTELSIGNTLGNLLDDPEIAKLMTPETKEIIADTAVVHLTSGLNGASLSNAEGTADLSTAPALQGFSRLAAVIRASDSKDISAGGNLADKLSMASNHTQFFETTAPSKQQYITAPVGGFKTYKADSMGTILVPAMDFKMDRDVLKNIGK